MKKYLLVLSLLFGAASVVLGCVLAVMTGIEAIDRANDFRDECINKSKGLQKGAALKLRDVLNQRFGD
ncbi:MAG: hypothetical protein FWG45_00860 [Oscillospiraceae bacterium]|nr:hypothetical protein [Oscillospiraceae bacterium]